MSAETVLCNELCTEPNVPFGRCVQIKGHAGPHATPFGHTWFDGAKPGDECGSTWRGYRCFRPKGHEGAHLSRPVQLEPGASLAMGQQQWHDEIADRCDVGSPPGIVVGGCTLPSGHGGVHHADGVGNWDRGDCPSVLPGPVPRRCQLVQGHSGDHAADGGSALPWRWSVGACEYRSPWNDACVLPEGHVGIHRMTSTFRGIPDSDTIPAPVSLPDREQLAIIREGVRLIHQGSGFAGANGTARRVWVARHCPASASLFSNLGDAEMACTLTMARVVQDYIDSLLVD